MIGSKKQRDHVTKVDMSSPMLSEEAAVLICVINAQEERDVAVVGIPSASSQTVASDDVKGYLSSEIEGCKSFVGEIVSTEPLTTCEFTGPSAVYEFGTTLECDRIEQSSKECLIAMRSAAMRPGDDLQVTKQSQLQVVDWRLSGPFWREAILILKPVTKILSMT